MVEKNEEIQGEKIQGEEIQNKEIQGEKIQNVFTHQETNISTDVYLELYLVCI